MVYNDLWGGGGDNVGKGGTHPSHCAKGHFLQKEGRLFGGELAQFLDGGV